MEISGSAADSYVTVLEYDSYSADYLGSDTATEKSESDKEQYLRRATQILDFGWIWKGNKAKETQSREFPRIGLYDRDGYSISSSIIPISIKYAEMEIAETLATGVDLTPVVEAGMAKRKNVKAGPVSVDIEYAFPTTSPVITSVNKLISMWILGSIMQPHIVRG